VYGAMSIGITAKDGKQNQNCGSFNKKRLPHFLKQPFSEETKYYEIKFKKVVLKKSGLKPSQKISLIHLKFSAVLYTYTISLEFNHTNVMMIIRLAD
jgi:hypothetical protein